ncbi:DUF3662 and FHA domain-containing protein [Corynebacterium frankenforstense]|uniref:DUF3662 and FHA domain-containing protein n=3 Tax=Corynebacterium TaxID=1716 RepID=UPI00254F2EA8|nr:DUF3662 and FHA domain-containing protein [Corynebacterium frankenforstense]MDK6259577.1 DUF3662 and FHA domain-containing protein [Corynebacterium frankenforstense]
MATLDRFARFDSTLQRGLDNAFALVFGGRLVPAEIEELLKQEIEDNLYHEDDYTEAPNVFQVGISRTDLDNLAESHPTLPEMFAEQLARYCRNQGWVPAGPISVVLAEETGMRTGQLRASSYSDPSPAQGCGFDAIDDAAPADVAGTAPVADDDSENPAGRHASPVQESENMNAPHQDNENFPATEVRQAAGWGDPRQAQGWTNQPSRPDQADRADQANRAAEQVGPDDQWHTGPGESAPAGASAADASAVGAAGAAGAAAAGGAAAAAAPADQAGSSGASASTAGRWREEPTDSAARSEPAQPAAATATVSLLLQDGSSRTYHVHEGSNILGRSTTADFRLPDTGVSREHAELSWNGHDAVLTDLKSTNGTTVNDTPVDNWLLDDGDVITMGHSRIEVRIVRPGN